MKDLKGKKILVLGNTYSTVGVVKLAKKMGLEVTVVGKDPEGDAVAPFFLLVLPCYLVPFRYFAVSRSNSEI